MTLDITLSAILRLLLVFIFLRAAAHKAGDRPRFVAQLRAYRLLPEHCLHTAALLLILIEVFLAATLLIPGWLLPSLVAAALLSLYALAMAINLARGRNDLDCGCGGPTGIAQAISWALVARNASLAMLALAAALPVAARAFAFLDAATIALASIAACLMYCAMEQAIVNRQRERRYFARPASTQTGAPL